MANMRLLVLVIQTVIQLLHLIAAYKAHRAARQGREYRPPHRLLKILCQHQWTRNRRDVWASLERNWEDFWWMTAELPPSLAALCRRLAPALNRRRRNGREVPGRRTLDTRNRLLATIIWFRGYLKLTHLGVMFGVSPMILSKILHHVIPILHEYLVPRFIRWPSNAEWQRRRGDIDHFPSAVGYIDGTPFRISRPKGRIQRLFYRGDKKFHFLNWIMIVDSRGYIVYSKPGFAGHLHDAICYR